MYAALSVSVLGVSWLWMKAKMMRTAHRVVESVTHQGTRTTNCIEDGTSTTMFHVLPRVIVVRGGNELPTAPMLPTLHTRRGVGNTQKVGVLLLNIWSKKPYGCKNMQSFVPTNECIALCTQMTCNSTLLLLHRNSPSLNS